MNTYGVNLMGRSRRRRRHMAEFKAAVIGECLKPSVSAQPQRQLAAQVGCLQLLVARASLELGGPRCRTFLGRAATAIGRWIVSTRFAHHGEVDYRAIRAISLFLSLVYSPNEAKLLQSKKISLGSTRALAMSCQ